MFKIILPLKQSKKDTDKIISLAKEHQMKVLSGVLRLDAQISKFSRTQPIKWAKRKRGNCRSW